MNIVTFLHPSIFSILQPLQCPGHFPRSVQVSAWPGHRLPHRECPVRVAGSGHESVHRMNPIETLQRSPELIYARTVSLARDVTETATTLQLHSLDICSPVSSRNTWNKTFGVRLNWRFLRSLFPQAIAASVGRLAPPPRHLIPLSGPLSRWGNSPAWPGRHCEGYTVASPEV